MTSDCRLRGHAAFTHVCTAAVYLLFGAVITSKHAVSYYSVQPDITDESEAQVSGQCGRLQTHLLVCTRADEDDWSGGGGEVYVTPAECVIVENVPALIFLCSAFECYY